MNYIKIYDSLIKKAQTASLTRYTEKTDGIYYENHHILPRCMGGDNTDNNMILLTPEEHFLAHLLLIKLHPDIYYLYLSIQIMIGSGKYIKNNKIYGAMKRKISVFVKEHGMPPETRKKISISKKGKKFTQTHKDNLSAARMGRSWESLFGEERASELHKERSQERGPLSDQTKLNISNSKKGITPHVWTIEMKQKVSNTMSGVKKSEEMKQKLKDYNKQEKICPHCGKMGSGISMKRWHFTNCKNKIC